MSFVVHGISVTSVRELIAGIKVGEFEKTWEARTSANRSRDSRVQVCAIIIVRSIKDYALRCDSVCNESTQRSRKILCIILTIISRLISDITTTRDKRSIITINVLLFVATTKYVHVYCISAWTAETIDKNSLIRIVTRIHLNPFTTFWPADKQIMRSK